MYEELGAFYLGRPYDLDLQDVVPGEQPLLYDSKDLTTHAVCVGMTGSGKTGLGVTLIEEAAIDGIPVIAIDPKGDLGNLLLTFPSLRGEDFEPWVDEADAARHGRTVDEHAQWTADLWREGLKRWGQKPSRIAAFERAADRTIYTPGSRSGVPISVLRSWMCPAAAVMEDQEALRDRILTAVSGVLGLVGLDADPIQSREHVLVSTLLSRAWHAGLGLDLPTLIQQIQKPPVERVGVLDLESFFPASDRFQLAMRLNNLLASPGFSVWSEGEPLDTARLLYTANGQPRLSVLSIAHLSDAERMFFVTMLLNDVVSWVRSQPGSRSLRAILYMDEIFGYVPPTANPPSKRPMLTLLKQARAHGLGVVLSTQNPVDLDYKGLSNAGTWFIGRLQTERDKARLMDGLEGASADSFERDTMDRLLSGLTSRVFLMSNAHEDAPVLFQTRWALSYLSGPLTAKQIARLTAERTDTVASPAGPVAAPAAVEPPTPEGQDVSSRPTLPANVDERFLPIMHPPIGDQSLVYRPTLAATATLHYANAKARVDDWQDVTMLAPLNAAATSPWKGGFEIQSKTATLDTEPQVGARFSALPAAAANTKSYVKWKKMLASHLYRERPLRLWRCRKPRLVSGLGETEGDFKVRLRDSLREQRDLDIEKLRTRYAPKLAKLQERIRAAEHRIEVEREQYSQKKTQTAISVGATVVGALFGRKLGSLGNIGRATTAMRGAGRAARERGDIARATEKLSVLRGQLKDLERKFGDDIADRKGTIDVETLDITELRIACRKADLEIQNLMVVWTPWRVGTDGIAEPAYEA
jgi:hypothetical protein